LTSQGLEEKLITAAESGNAALVKRLIKKGANLHFVENPEVGSVVMGKLGADVVQHSLPCFAPSVQLGYNALHYAAFNGYMDVVEGLVLAGAEVNRATTV
jgi:ankyrin repeat protein